MVLVLLGLFIGLPVLEIWLLLEAGGEIGLLPTVGLCVATAIIGTWLTRSQGRQLLAQAQHRLSRGELPAREVVDGLLIAVAGVLLVTPGFVTDSLGLLLLLPPTRALVRVWAMATLGRRLVASGGPSAHFGGGGPDLRGGPGWPYGGSPFAERPRGPDVQPQPDVEFLPPGRTPRAPGQPRPPIIDVDEQ